MHSAVHSAEESGVYCNSSRIICHFPNTPCVFLPRRLFILFPLPGVLFLYPLTIQILPTYNASFCGHLSHGLSWFLPPFLAEFTPFVPDGACHICPWRSGLMCTFVTATWLQTWRAGSRFDPQRHVLPAQTLCT